MLTVPSIFSQNQLDLYEFNRIQKVLTEALSQWLLHRSAHVGVLLGVEELGVLR